MFFIVFVRPLTRRLGRGKEVGAIGGIDLADTVWGDQQLAPIDFGALEPLLATAQERAHFEHISWVDY